MFRNIYYVYQTQPLDTQSLFQKCSKKLAHGILNEINSSRYSFKIPYQNSHASLVCLLPPSSSSSSMNTDAC